jgi:hypothetical protein
MKGLKKSSSTTDSIAIWINDTLSKAPYPSGSGIAVDTIFRTLGKDSIFYKKNNITYAIKDSVGNTSGFVPYTGATSNVNLGTKNITANAYFNGFTSMFAKNDTIILSIDSTPVHLVKGSGGQGFKLPVATTLANGTIFSFNNNQSSGVINVVSNSGANTLVKSVPSGAYLNLELTDNTTATGTWDAHFQTPSNVSWSTNTLDYNGSITSAQWNGTTVTYNRGGTGQSSSFTQGGVVYGSSTTAMATTSAGTTGQMLVSAGTGTPTWADTTVFLRKNDSSTYYTKYRSDTSRTNIYTAINAKQTNLDLLQSITYGIKAEPYGCTFANVTSQLAMTSTGMYFYPFNWNVSDSIRGVAFFNRILALAVTPSNYNGMAIYSVSGATLTRVVQTTNSGTFWDGSANTWKTQAFTPTFLAKGTYYIGYQASASSGLPTIASGTIMQTGLIEPPVAVNPNATKLSFLIANNTASAPSSVAMGSATSSQRVPYFILY